MVPFCVIGNAGTINTGAIDDLHALAELCQREKLWFHVDGAIGAVAVLADNVRPQLAGMERADSLALDLHKWMHVPFEAGWYWCAAGGAPRAQPDAGYQPIQHESGLASGSFWFSDYGLQLTAVPRAEGVAIDQGTRFGKIGRMIARNVDRRATLAAISSRSSGSCSHRPRHRVLSIQRADWTGAVGGAEPDILGELQNRASAPSYTTLNGTSACAWPCQSSQPLERLRSAGASRAHYRPGINGKVSFGLKDMDNLAQ
jgi:hypothetical protein